MKYLFILIISISFISCSEDINLIQKIEPATFCDCNELILDTDYQRYYLSNKKEPFTGNCITLKADGIKAFERNYKSGKYDGLVIVFHSNGKIKSTTEYKKNLMTGAQKIYSPDGNLISHALYLRSRLKEIIK